MNIIGTAIICLAITGNPLAINHIANATVEDFAFKPVCKAYSYYPRIFTNEPHPEFFRLVDQFIGACYLYQASDISEKLFKKKGENCWSAINSTPFLK